MQTCSSSLKERGRRAAKHKGRVAPQEKTMSAKGLLKLSISCCCCRFLARLITCYNKNNGCVSLLRSTLDRGISMLHQSRLVHARCISSNCQCLYRCISHDRCISCGMLASPASPQIVSRVRNQFYGYHILKSSTIQDISIYHQHQSKDNTSK